jgi:hypothetical protein
MAASASPRVRAGSQALKGIAWILGEVEQSLHGIGATRRVV